MLSVFSHEITALFQVVLIDLVLAGDNAIVIGLAASGLPLDQRARAVLVGIVAATVLRITFAWPPRSCCSWSGSSLPGAFSCFG